MRLPDYTPSKVVSGGQTGADRTGRDVVTEPGIPCGGWCPKGLLAEDDTLPECHPLEEHESNSDKERTVASARDADITVVFTIDPVTVRGSGLTITTAHCEGKPVLHLKQHFSGMDVAGARGRLVAFLEKHGSKVLNIADLRASAEPAVHEWTSINLRGALGAIGEAIPLHEWPKK